MSAPSEPRKRRVRFDLDDGHMDICLDPDATAETIEALKDLGQIAIRWMEENVPASVSANSHSEPQP